MHWILNNLSNVLSAIGLLASIGSLAQSRKAAEKADEASQASKQATAQTVIVAGLIRAELVEAAVLSHLSLAQSLGSEIETLMTNEIYPAALIRSRDLSKQLGYLIKRWDDVVPKQTLVGLVDAKSQMETLASRIEPSRAVSSTERRRLLTIVQRVSNVLMEEHAAAQKRKDDNVGLT